MFSSGKRNRIKPAPRKLSLSASRPAPKAKRNERLSAPGPTRDWSRIRVGAVGVCLAMAWVALWGRAFYLQVLDGDNLASRAQRQHVATEYMQGPRGQILDRNGRLLAKSVEFGSVYVRPFEVTERDRAADELSRELGMPRGRVWARLGKRSKFVWIKRDIDDRQAAAVAEAQLDGVHLTREYARTYPNRTLAGRLLGFVGVDENGLEGLERSLDPILKGRESSFTVQRDASGARLFLDPEGNEVSIAGKDVRLTLDAAIQSAAEEALAKAVQKNEGNWGATLVVDVPTGDILAWAEYPFFNPNDYKKAKPAWWRNGIAVDALEPGSTIKPLIVAAALQEGVCEPDSLYYCEDGRWRVNGVPINDTHDYTWLPVNKVVRYSSNICSAKIGLSMGARSVHDYLERLGFGHTSDNLPMPQAKGILRPAKGWNNVELATASFGQGFSVTPLQLAKAYLTLGSGGVVRPLRLVLDPADETGQGDGPESANGEGKRVFSEDVAAEVMSMLSEVVETDGTGTQARIPGLLVGGKTGTAQKASAKGGYGKDYLASFAGFVPVDKPRLLLVVMVDEPKKSHYGGVVCAPAFKETAVSALAYLGEMPEERVGLASADGLPSTVFGNYASAPADMLGADGLVKRVASKSDPNEGDAPRRVSHDERVVPDLSGVSLRRAMEIFARRGLVPRIEGDGVVVSGQTPAPGVSWDAAQGQELVLRLAEQGERS